MGLSLAPRCTCGQCGAPALVAFSGKRQWVELLNTGRARAQWVKTVPLGPQSLRPQVRVQACRAASGNAALGGAFSGFAVCA